MDKELQVVSEIMEWFRNSSPSLEELQQRNIVNASQVRYSTLGKNYSSKGCYEFAYEYELCLNVKPGKMLKKKPSRDSGYIECYLDDNDRLLCAKRLEIQYNEPTTEEDHYLIDWNESTFVYGLSYQKQPINNITIYFAEGQQIYAKAVVGIMNTAIDHFEYYFELYYFYYRDDGKMQKIALYSFHLPKYDLKEGRSFFRTKIVNGVTFSYLYSECNSI